MKTLRTPSIALVLSLVVLFVLFSMSLSAATTTQEVPPNNGKVVRNANLRSGPGTTFPITGSARTGDLVAIVECNDECDWYRLDNGKWIAAFLVEDTAASTPAVVDSTTALSQTTTITSTTTSITTASVASASNLRSGPGTNYDRVGSVQSGQELAIVGQNAAGDWLQLSDGKWIASFLVTNAPSDLAVVEPPAANQPMATEPATPASTDVTVEVITTAWQEGNDLNVTQSCGHFEYKITDVRRKKSLWFYNREYIAQGEWLLVFVEAKNISSGTSHLGNGSPRLTVLTVDGNYASGTGDSKASSYASWMFQHGRFYEDVNPGQVLGMVEAYDLPLQPDMLLAFSMKECPDDLLSLGVWSNIQQPDK